MNTPFLPPFLLKNRHVQSLVSSAGPRSLAIKAKSRLLQRTNELIRIDLPDQVSLSANLHQTSQPKGLVVLLHGWEGSADSLYILSLSTLLLEQGYSLVRLNFRDHGNSHHLNKQLFNSTRLSDIMNALKLIQSNYSPDGVYLVGFSLGGNFALRLSSQAKQQNLRLHKTVAVCPLINPAKTIKDLENGPTFYHRYFVHKWQRSLKKKLRYYPELGYGSALLSQKSLSQMNDYFVPNHTAYDTAESYLTAYAIDQKTINSITSPTHIISASDDPIVQSLDLNHLDENALFKIELSPYGGHCGFIENYRLESWADKRILALLEEHSLKNHKKP
jgi:hypothetical protein